MYDYDRRPLHEVVGSPSARLRLRVRQEAPPPGVTHGRQRCIEGWAVTIVREVRAVPVVADGMRFDPVSRRYASTALPGTVAPRVTLG
jgi:hypothetical protein